MALNVQQFYGDMRRRGGMVDSPNTESSFLRAVNATINECNSPWGTSIDEIDDANTGSIDCTKAQENALYSGCVFHLQRLGAWGQDPDAEAKALFYADLRAAIGAIIRDDSSFRTRHQRSS